VKLSASQINVADLAKPAGIQTPVAGTLAADVSVSGTQLSPAGHGTLSLTQAKVGVEPVQSVNLNFQGTGEQVNAKLAVKLPAGAANATLTYLPRQQGYNAQLQATGIQLAQLQTIKNKNLELTGVLNLVAGGRGTLKDPSLQATAEIPRLDVRNQAISGLKLQASVANRVANVALDSNVVNTSVRARATVNLTGNYDTNATFDTQSIPFAPLVAAYAPSQAGSFTGQAEIHGTLRGPLKDKSRLDAHITIPQLAVYYKNTIQLAEVSPIRIDFANGVLQLQRSAIRGTGTDVQFQGTIPVSGSAPMSLLLLGNVDLRLAQLLDPDIASSGQVRFDINSYGQRANPDVQGRVEIVNANFATGQAPIGLQNGNGMLTLTKDRLDVTQFQGTVGGGTLSASGGIIYRPSLQFDLAMTGSGIRLLYPDGVRTGLDTNLALSGTTDSALLRGQVRIEQLQFVPGFDLMDFMGQFGGGETTPPPSQGFSQNLRLDIAVQSTSGVNLVSRTLSVQGSANLRVNGTAAQPVVLGRVNLTGGDLIFSGNRYLLQGGTIDFVNRMQTQPVVNVAVNTTIQQYNIQMRFWGPADHLHTNYASDPALPPSDIINLIAFGKTTEASAANPTPPGNLGAESLVASQVSSQITSRVEKIAGISQLSVDPELGSSTQNPGARVAIQQRVSSKIFVTFVTDVTSTQRQVIKLEYQVSPRLSVSGVRDENGGLGFDTKIRKTW
jgi:translocation and assembly module TamB